MHVCMYACMYVCMHACMHVCMYACMHACMHVCMYVFMYVYTYIYIYIHIIYIYIYIISIDLNIYILYIIILFIQVYNPPDPLSWRGWTRQTGSPVGATEPAVTTVPCYQDNRKTHRYSDRHYGRAGRPRGVPASRVKQKRPSLAESDGKWHKCQRKNRHPDAERVITAREPSAVLRPYAKSVGETAAGNKAFPFKCQALLQPWPIQCDSSEKRLRQKS